MRHIKIKDNYFLFVRKKLGRYVEIRYNYEGTVAPQIRKDFDYLGKRLLGGHLFNPDVSLQRCIDKSIGLIEKLYVAYPLQLENGMFLHNEQEVRNHLKEIWE